MIGQTVYADVFDAPDSTALDDAQLLADALQTSCRRGRATVLRTHAQKFEPQGVTVVCLLAESHAAVHTYPEDAGYMLDVFTCGETADARLIAESFVDMMGGAALYQQVERGRRIRSVTAA